MEDLDAPLDFESEDSLACPAPGVNDGKRKKIIGLDDLLSEFYHGVNPVDKSKKSKTKHSNSDDEDNTTKNKEKLLSKLVSECQKQVYEIQAEDNIPLWGRRAFAQQRSPPPHDSRGLVKSNLLNSFRKIQFNSVLEMTIDPDESFLEGLLVDGWLLNMVLLCGSVEDCVASWTFYQTLHSTKDNVQESGCNFWCNILPTEDEVNKTKVSFRWFPSFRALTDALEVYGYLSCSNPLSPSIAGNNDSDICGPPTNIRCWLKLVAAFCRMRYSHRVFSTSEVEELFLMIVYLFLDRRLQGLSFLLDECMFSITAFFTEEEWPPSSEKIATSIADRFHPVDLNCLRVVECISGVDERSRALRGLLSLRILTHSMGKPGAKTVDVLKSVSSDNVKDRDCDFLKMYIRLVLAENWLASDPPTQEQQAVSEAWSRYLRNLSTQISNTDWRAYAAKVRNKASYLLQSM